MRQFWSNVKMQKMQEYNWVWITIGIIFIFVENIKEAQKKHL